MRFTQQFVTSLSPGPLAAAMEAESRQWILQCRCGDERSVWEAGGIRYGAWGNPIRMVWCPSCRRSSWHFVYKQPQKPQQLEDHPGISIKTPPVRPRVLSRALGQAFTIIGAILLVAAVGSKARHWHFERSSHATIGIVERLVDRSPGLSPYVGYQVDGHSHHITSSMATNPSAYEVGEEVEVRYRPENPTDARIYSFIETSLFTTIFGSLGMVFAAVGTLCLLHAGRR